MTKKDLKIVFFGTPEFAVASLDALVKNDYNVVGVVTAPDKPAGRGKKIQMSDVKKYAIENNLNVLQPEKLKNPEFIEELKNLKADLFIVIAFRMLPEIVWQMPHLGTFNLHASLLPKYRGAAPINHAIINGETETGITIFFLKHEIDTGDMIQQKRISIDEEDNLETVYTSLMNLGAEAVVETIESILNGSLKTIPQPEGEYVAAPKIFKEFCKINWNQPSKKIHDFIRGLSPVPGAWCEMIELNGKPSDVKILKTSLKDIPEDLSLSPGEAMIGNKSLFAGTSTTPIRICTIQPAGKKSMPAEAFILGYHPNLFK